MGIAGSGCEGGEGLDGHGGGEFASEAGGRGEESGGWLGPGAVGVLVLDEESDGAIEGSGIGREVGFEARGVAEPRGERGGELDARQDEVADDGVALVLGPCLGIGEPLEGGSELARELGSGFGFEGEDGAEGVSVVMAGEASVFGFPASHAVLEPERGAGLGIGVRV